jgi:hypothetical protein
VRLLSHLGAALIYHSYDCTLTAGLLELGYMIDRVSMDPVDLLREMQSASLEVAGISVLVLGFFLVILVVLLAPRPAHQQVRGSEEQQTGADRHRNNPLLADKAVEERSNW